MLQITQQKTGNRVAIPVHWMVSEILEKYEGNLPRSISNQKLNDYLKELGQLVGLNEKVTKTITKGGVKRIITHQKYELLSSHTARRSFATNLFRDGFPSESIRKITGHKTERAFLKYLKLTNEQHAQMLAMHWRKKNPLRVAK